MPGTLSTSGSALGMAFLIGRRPAGQGCGWSRKQSSWQVAEMEAGFESESETGQAELQGLTLPLMELVDFGYLKFSC